MTTGAPRPAASPPRILRGLGRPIGSIIQYAYTVADAQRSMEQYRATFGVGPWWQLGPFSPENARYRGRPTSMRVTLLRAFAGDTMIELIEQHDDEPSVYRELIDRRGHGFHHWAIGSDDIEADITRLGYPVVFEDLMPTGARVVYVDSTPDLPGMIELLEMVPEQERRYEMLHASAQNWDGADPVRRG